jgi:hypothetical protein
LDLSQKVFVRAQQVNDFKKIKAENSQLAVAVLQKISAMNRPDRAKVEKLDPILSRKDMEQTAVADLNPGKKKVPPERQDPSVGAKRFRELIIKQLATSARALAFLWDAIYQQAGSPDLSGYRSYRYPVKVDFVPLDYIPANFVVPQSAKEKK